MNPRPPLDLRLYVLIDPDHLLGRPAADVARAVIRGGATVLQVRAKQAGTREMLALCETVLAVARPAGVPVLINDRADVASAAGAEGVHVGARDLPVDAVRAILGPGAWIGYSATSDASARVGERAGADYLGAGDVFGTATKPDAEPAMGLDGLARIAATSPLPVVAIGGVTLANAPAAVRAGAAGVAVISAVTHAADIEMATRALRRIVDAELGR